MFYYGWWEIGSIPLLVGSIIFNYFIGVNIVRLIKNNDQKKMKILLFLGVSFNLLLLGYYKYVNFFLDNLKAMNLTHLSELQIVLPLGISFFTFTQIAFLVDAYRGNVEKVNFFNYMLFISYFPHLLAGPIIHHKEMIPQFDRLRNKILNHKNLCAGLFLFSIGMAKKMIIADNFAAFANDGFTNYMHLSFFTSWLTSLSYMFQIFFDFSGYTDMALGLSLMLNLKLPMNFNSPYKAVNIQDFWKRWHITLSRFLRDYLYIPLGGNRNGDSKTYLNIMTTFLLGGLWHGASWTFVLWGFLHGFGMVVHRIWRRLDKKMHYILAWLITFCFVDITFVVFRAKSIDQAFTIIRGMFDFKGFDGFKFDPYILGLFVIGFILIFFLKNSDSLVKAFKPNLVYLFITILLLFISISDIGEKSIFIYFRF